jgi:F-type H+-transporting ATPase subunit gamma
MATLRDIKRKIDAVKKTSQITKAMNMVAAAKLRGAQANMEKFHPYAVKFREVIGRLAGGATDSDTTFALMTPREEVKKIEVVVMTADRGLCGSFNNNLIVTAEKMIRSKRAEGIEISITGAGRKGADYFRRRTSDVRARHIGLLNKPSYDDARRIGNELIDLFESGAVDEVYVVYSNFRSMAKQIPTLLKLLPLEPEASEAPVSGAATEYLFEPSHEELLTDLLPNYVYIQLLEFLYQTSVSEHAARMTAMENATSNCKELVRSLTLTYNKARQASITKELMDIVGGAEALKG